MEVTSMTITLQVQNATCIFFFPGSLHKENVPCTPSMHIGEVYAFKTFVTNINASDLIFLHFSTTLKKEKILIFYKWEQIL